MFRSAATRRFLITILTVVVISAASFGSWIYQVDRRKSAVLKQAVSDMAASLQHRDVGRPLLRGKPQEGNAWTDYRRALSELSATADPIESRFQLQLFDNKEQHGLREVFLDRHAGIVDELRRGATRGSSRDEDMDERAPAAAALRAETAVLAATLVQIEAHAKWTRADSVGAIESLLDLCQFGRDCLDSRSSFMEKTGPEIIDLAFDEWSLILSSKLDRPAAQLAVDGLAILDEFFPRHQWKMQAALCSSGEYLLKTYDRGHVINRLEWAADFERVCRLVERAEALERRPWKEAAIELAAIGEETLAAPSWQHQVRDHVPEIVDATREKVRRFAHTEVRILRVATEYNRTGKLLDLEDPVGDKLLHSVGEDHVKIWSAQADRAANLSDEDRASRQRMCLKIPR